MKAQFDQGSKLCESDMVKEKGGLPYIQQNKLTEFLEGDFSQSEISKIVNSWEKKGYIEKETGRPNLLQLRPSVVEKLADELGVKQLVETNDKINRIIEELVDNYYSRQPLDNKAKKRLLNKADKEIIYLSKDAEELSVPEVDKFWGDLISELSRTSKSNDPREWMRLATKSEVKALGEGIETRIIIDIRKVIENNDSLEIKEEWRESEGLD